MLKIDMKDFEAHAQDVVDHVTLRNEPVRIHTRTGDIILLTNEMHLRLVDTAKERLFSGKANLGVSTTEELILEDILTTSRPTLI